MKSESYIIKTKFYRNTTSATLDVYEFKMVILQNGETESFPPLLRNFQMSLDASGAILAS